MNKIFLDTNVVLGFLLDRNPFSDDIAEIFEITNTLSISRCVSSLTIANVNYIISRIEDRQKAILKTRKLLKLVDAENVGKSVIVNSVISNFKKIEDGIQNFSAEESNHKIIITRNVKDFKFSKLAILNPTEYLVKIRNGL